MNKILEFSGLDIETKMVGFNQKENSVSYIPSKFKQSVYGKWIQ